MIIKPILRVILKIIIFLTIILACLFLFLSFYGKSILEDIISKASGYKIRVHAVYLDFKNNLIDLRGVSAFNKTGERILDAKKIALKFDNNKLIKEKKVLINYLIISDAIFNFKREKKGDFNLTSSKPGKGKNIGSFYKLINNIKVISIRDSHINFRDFYIKEGPFSISLDNFGLDIMQEDRTTLDYIPLKCNLGFSLPGAFGKGNLFLTSELLAYENKLDLNAVFEAENIDVMQLTPYAEHYTPFHFGRGVFNSKTKLIVKDNFLNSLTTLVFDRLLFAVDPSEERANFLEVSVSKLLPYLQSQEGEVLFDFVISGKLDNLHGSLGPQVRQTIQSAVVGEVISIIQQLQQMQR